MEQQQQSLIGKQDTFPFRLEDLESWTVRRSDGTITKYLLKDTKGGFPLAASNTVSTGTSTNLFKAATWCEHKPDTIPIVSFPRGKGVDPLKLFIGNSSGARATKSSFDFVIDTGDIMNAWDISSSVISGDAELAEGLAQYTVENNATRILQIDWDDRQAPNVTPEFWVEMNKLLYGDVMTCCVGGHGRSGTSFVCLLLVNAPDYDALDAMIHVRSVHCPRAIESVAQHDYINQVAKYLGRTENAHTASSVKDYKAAFRASKKPTAVRTRKMLKW